MVDHLNVRKARWLFYCICKRLWVVFCIFGILRLGGFLLNIHSLSPNKTPPPCFPLPCCLLLLLWERDRKRDWSTCQKIPFLLHPISNWSTGNPPHPSKAFIHLQISPIRRPTFPSSPYSSPTTLSLHGIPKSPWPPHPTFQLHQKGPLEDHLGPPRPRSWPDQKAGCYWRMGENLQRGTKKFRCPAIPSLQSSRGGASCCQRRGGCDSLRSHLGANFPLFALLHKGVYQWQSPTAKGALGYHCPCWKGPFCGLLSEWWVLCFKHSGLHLCFPF